MHKEISGLRVEIIGGAGLAEQVQYLESLQAMVHEKDLDGVMHLVGPLANNDIVTHLQRADLFVNTSLTGSLDKAVLEAMSCGVPVLTCNEALLEVLGPYTNQLMFARKDVAGLAEKIQYMDALGSGERARLGLKLREIVVRDHGLRAFVKKIIGIL